MESYSSARGLGTNADGRFRTGRSQGSAPPPRWFLGAAAAFASCRLASGSKGRETAIRSARALRRAARAHSAPPPPGLLLQENYGHCKIFAYLFGGREVDSLFRRTDPLYADEARHATPLPVASAQQHGSAVPDAA